MSDEQLGIGTRIKHPILGKGVVVETGTDTYSIYFNSAKEVKGISKDFEFEVMDATEGGGMEVVSLADVEMMINKVLDQRADIQTFVPLGNKWEKGILILKPSDESLKSKEIPMETFFHKIVMVRDRLRVMEQNINSHKVLSDEEKVHLQQYITRIYGSLTTFNVLFKESHHGFRGESSS